MAMGTALDLYMRHVRAVPAAERLQLLVLIAQDLADRATLADERPLRSIMEFRGVGKDSWDGTDAQEYVNQLRGEWDERPG